MSSQWLLRILCCFLVLPAAARRADPGICGTSRENTRARLFLHRQAMRARAGLRPLATPASTNRDFGDVAVIDAADGVISRLNQFSLDATTLTFQPSSANAASYKYSLAAGGYDASAAQNGSPLVALDDDDTRQVALPFSFPFFGATYDKVFVNSDGNLTFTAGDNASADRSVARMTAGPPRIAPLYDDLNPGFTAGGVRVLSNPAFLVVSWVQVPEYASSGGGSLTNFQVALYPDGRIRFSYSGVLPALNSAVVGIAPGNLRGSTTLVDFRTAQSGDYSAAVVEWFSNVLSLDIARVAQKFYETHEDAYDYLVVFNNADVAALGDALAYEQTVRSQARGFGLDPWDDGWEYGSASRLQAMINMGQLSQWAADVANGTVSGRPGDTPLSILSHEAGHLFLAYASIADPQNPSAQPMLGYQAAHWSFFFNSEASFLEGERILDRGAGVSPQFVTAETVNHYAPLDQYLMGFRAPSDVPDTFVVRNPASGISASAHPPQTPARFDGAKQAVKAGDVIQVMGRRTPDSTVAQRRFRFAFVVVVQPGTDPAAGDLAKINAFQQQFGPYFAKASDNNGSVETVLRKSMKLSLFPAAGVVAGASGTATLTVATPPKADMQVVLQTAQGAASAPAAVTIPAGSGGVSFSLNGVAAGVEELTATPPTDSGYETAYARVQVAAPASLTLAVVSGGQQPMATGGPLADPIVARLADVNGLPYPGSHILAAASAGGTVDPAEAVADAGGSASFRWTPGPAAASQLRLELKGAPSVSATVLGGSTAPVLLAVQNGASFTSGIAAGAFETVWGANLAGGRTVIADPSWPVSLGGVSVLLNGTAMKLLYVSDTQINFYVPPEAALGPGTLAVLTPSGTQVKAPVNVASVQPGIFPRAILLANTALRADDVGVKSGDYIEIYCSGLGPTQVSGGYQWTLLPPTVFIGATPVDPVFSGLSRYTGLYQLNVRIPSTVAQGIQPVMVSIGQLHSNVVNIKVQ